MTTQSKPPRPAADFARQVATAATQPAGVAPARVRFCHRRCDQRSPVVGRSASTCIIMQVGTLVGELAHMQDGTQWPCSSIQMDMLFHWSHCEMEPNGAR